MLEIDETKPPTFGEILDGAEARGADRELAQLRAVVRILKLRAKEPITEDELRALPFDEVLATFKYYASRLTPVIQAAIAGAVADMKRRTH